MATTTYIPLATVTLTSTDSFIVFSSIPDSFRDLIIVSRARNSVAANYLMQMNSDTGSNYSTQRLQGNGSAASAATTSSQTSLRLNGFDDVITTFSNLVIIQIMDYSATDKHKTVLARNNTASLGVTAVAGRYASTSAITSVTLFPSSGSFQIDSTFSLYGIAS
jgi:hypothetical protein